MSGGKLGYREHEIGYIIEDIEEHMRSELSIHDSDKTKNTLNDCIALLRKAQVYVKRVDAYLSGDDGEENFHIRLNEELEELSSGA
jgi:hypothetical protein